MNANNRFILGIGRSGTSFLSRLAGLTSSPVKRIDEPFPGIKQKREKRKIDASFCNPFDKNEIASFKEMIERLHTDYYFSESLTKRIKRNASGNNTLLIKEVHSLLTFPEFTKQLDAKAVVVTRDISRIMDSHFHGNVKNKKDYLLEEYNFVRGYLKCNKSESFELLDMALANTSNRVIKYVKRPKLAVSEIIRQSCITEILTNFLIVWSIQEPNVLKIKFEDLCTQPLEEMKKVFNFLDLEYNHNTEDEISKITTGKQTNYFDTEKNSISVLEQEYKCLSDKAVYLINRLQKK